MEPHRGGTGQTNYEDAFEAHCQRTCAIARLVAHHLFIPSEEKDLLAAACLLHHHRPGKLTPEAQKRPLAGGLGPVVAGSGRFEPAGINGLLVAYARLDTSIALESKLAGILRLADAFDHSMEEQPISGGVVDEILQSLQEGVPVGLWTEDSLTALIESTRPPDLGNPKSWRVPVFPQAALYWLASMRDPRASLPEVVKAASLDPAIAGVVVRLANSALFGGRTPVSTLPQAISRLGFTTSRKVITSAALRPLFSSPALEDAWKHCLQVADLAEQLAREGRTIDPPEAYLAGLLHDVGRLALLSIRLYDSARLHGLLSGGCPRVYAESLLLRTDHAFMGAEIAAGWRLPENMVSAIRYHHRIEKTKSPLAHLLHVAEYLSGEEEDLPSRITLETSLDAVGLSYAQIGDYEVSPLGTWLAAA